MANDRDTPALTPSAGQTDLRAGYTVHVEDYADMFRALSAENAALREKLEAAEAELRGTEDRLLIEIDHAQALQAALTDARAALAAHDQRVRDAALEEAAAVADLCERQNSAMPSTPYKKGLAAGAQAIAAALRVLKKGGET